MADLPVGSIGAAASSGLSGNSTPGSVAPPMGRTDTPPASPSRSAVKAAVADANQSLAENGTQLTFVFDDQVHRTIVKIVDTQTHKVVQQIPSEAMLAAARALSGTTASGALVNTKA